jgi:hypothetical protein
LAKRIVSWIRLGGLARQADDKGAVNGDENLLVPGLVSHEQQAQAIVPQDLQRLVGDVGFRVARPGQAQFSQAAGDLLGAPPFAGCLLGTWG